MAAAASADRRRASSWGSGGGILGVSCVGAGAAVGLLSGRAVDWAASASEAERDEFWYDGDTECAAVASCEGRGAVSWIAGRSDGSGVLDREGDWGRDFGSFSASDAASTFFGGAGVSVATAGGVTEGGDGAVGAGNAVCVSGTNLSFSRRRRTTEGSVTPERRIAVVGFKSVFAAKRDNIVRSVRLSSIPVPLGRPRRRAVPLILEAQSSAAQPHGGGRAPERV